MKCVSDISAAWRIEMTQDPLYMFVIEIDYSWLHVYVADVKYRRRNEHNRVLRYIPLEHVGMVVFEFILSFCFGSPRIRSAPHRQPCLPTCWALIGYWIYRVSQCQDDTIRDHSHPCWTYIGTSIILDERANPSIYLTWAANRCRRTLYTSIMNQTIKPLRRIVGKYSWEVTILHLW